MPKITDLMDFVSGLLLAYDFLPKSGKLKDFYEWIREKLKNVNTDNPGSWGMIIFCAAVSIFTFLMIICWIYSKPSSSSDTHFGAEMLSYSLGTLIAFGVFVVITMISKNRDTIFWSGATLAVVDYVLILAWHPSDSLVAGMIASTYIFLLFPLAVFSAKQIKGFLIEHPEKDYYIFAFFGLLIFIASSLIKINVDP